MNKKDLKAIISFACIKVAPMLQLYWENFNYLNKIFIDLDNTSNICIAKSYNNVYKIFLLYHVQKIKKKKNEYLLEVFENGTFKKKKKKER